MSNKPLSTSKRLTLLRDSESQGRRIAFYGGTFDPVHCGHLKIAEKLADTFKLDEFVFIPAFHAPHKPDREPTAVIDRYAMLSLATNDRPDIKISRMEIDCPQKPYTIDTLESLKEHHPDAELFFVMGADSWQDIRSWRDWEKVLTVVNHIVVKRPGYEIGFSHLTEDIRKRIVDMRGESSQFIVPSFEKHEDSAAKSESTGRIYITDAVSVETSSSTIRLRVRDDSEGWQKELPVEVAKYIEKYQIYK